MNEGLLQTDTTEVISAPVETPVEHKAETKKNIRILIADDHPIVRDGLRKLLLLEDDFEVVGEANDGCEVLDRVLELDPDVLLLDLRMPNLDGLSALQTLQQTNKRTRVIVLTASEDKNEFVQAMKLGCSGIVLKLVRTSGIAGSSSQGSSTRAPWRSRSKTGPTWRTLCESPRAPGTRTSCR